MLAPVIQRALSEAKKPDDICHVLRLADSLECPHFKRSIPPRLGLGESRRVSVDHARRDCVYAIAPRRDHWVKAFEDAGYAA
jgi:hypothetical protein